MIPEAKAESRVEGPRERRLYLWLASAVLLLTAAVSVLWSYEKLMDNDEYLSYYGDSAPTLADVVRIQLRYPISLDPPTYHLLSHLSMDVAGRNEMAMRIPALAGFLLFQAGLFWFVRRLAGSRAAVVAMLLPIASTMYHYAAVGRPYGLLLGLYAMSLVFWQSAARRQESGEARGLALVCLAVCLAVAITSHYFGILIMVPICLAELARSIARRRLDYGMIQALVAGMASVVLILPFRKAVLVYQQHYYIAGVHASVIREAYRAIFFRYDWWPEMWKSALADGLALVLVVLAVASVLRFRRRSVGEPVYEWFALMAIGALPAFGYLFGRFVTHTMEVRYVMAWQFAVMACVGIATERLLRKTLVFWGVVALILVGGMAIQRREILIYRDDKVAKMASLRIPEATTEQILSEPARRVYIQSLENFYTDVHYEPDERLRERFTFVYGEKQELGWLEHNTNYITAENMKHFTSLNLAEYGEFLAERKPLLVLYRNGWEWIDQDLATRGRAMVSQGPLMRGDLFEVQPAGMDVMAADTSAH